MKDRQVGILAVDVEEYKLGRQIGTGMTSNVFVAKFSKKTRAAKIFTTFHSFEKEFAMHSMYLQHIGGILQAKAVDIPNKIIFYSLLSEHDGWYLLDKCPTEPLGDGVSVLRSLARTLFALHKGHVVHNDLKPDNVFINVKTKQSLLIDFGLSTSIYDTSIRKLDYSISNHIHPLIKEHKKPFCIEGDIYSFGNLSKNTGKKLRTCTTDALVQQTLLH